MDPRQLLQTLMELSGDNPNSLAGKLRQKTKQPQLFKFLSGISKEPRRSTLQPVADFYKINVEAFYDPAVAAQVMENLKADRPLMGAAAPLPTPTVQASASPTVTRFEQRAGQRRRSTDIDVVDCFIDLLARADAPVLEAMAGLLPALARNPSNQQIVRSVRALFEPEAFPAKVQNNG